MSSQSLKRPSGGYSLRGPGAKKHLSEDFEYYFARLNPAENAHESLTAATVNNSLRRKRQGRTQKVQIIATVGSQQCDLTNSALNNDTSPFDCSSKQIIYIDQGEVSQVMKGEEVMCGLFKSSLNCEETEVATSQLLHHSQEDVGSRSSDSVDQQSEIVVLPDQFVIAGNSSMEDVRMVVINGDGVLVNEDRTIEGNVDIVNELSDDISDILPQLRPEDRVECLECHKLLKPGSFRQHIRTHTGEKPFSCELCEAHFTRKGDVDRHVRIVHNKQKPFQCPHCLRAFGDKKNLRWHLENHDKRLFYVCSVCGFKFGKREYYENHVRFLHPEESLKQEVKVKSKEDDNKDSDSLLERGYVMLVPLENMDVPGCLQVPAENGVDETLPPQLQQISDPNGVEAFVIQFNENGVESDLSTTCDSNTLKLSSEDCNGLKAYPSVKAVDKQNKSFDHDPAQVIELIMENDNDQPALQYIMKGCEDSRLMIGSDEEQYVIDDNGSIMQFIVDEC